MNGRPMLAISKRVKFGAALAVVLALAFPQLSIIQAVILTPALVAVAVIVLVVATVIIAARCDLVLRRPTIPHRQRHALRRFNFTTSSAWSAVLTRQTWEESPSPTWRIPVRHLTTKSTIARLDVIFDLIKSNFIAPWYARISPSHAFPDALEVVIRQCLMRIVHRGEQADWPDVLVSRITPLFTAHLHHYRTIEHLSSTSATPHGSLPLPLPRISHPALANTTHGNQTSSPDIESHLRTLVKRMLDHTLPDPQQTEVVCTIATEVVLGTILMPVFEILSDGDFWNRQIDERGGRYLHEQKQVNRFLSALSTLQPPLPTPATNSLPPGGRSLPPASSISINSSSKHFDLFLRSISKIKALGEARRLRADVDRELRNVSSLVIDNTNEKDTRTKRKYVERLKRAKFHIDERISVLSGETSKTSATPDAADSRTSPSAVTLYGMLSDPSSMAFFLEFMERRSRSRLVQFWLTIEGFKDPLESAGRFSALEQASTQAIGSTSGGENATIAEDVSFLHLAYFAHHDHTNDLGVPAKHQNAIREFAQRSDRKVSGEEAAQIKLAIFSAQDAAYAQMEEDDWPAFRKSELYRKALVNLERVSVPHVSGVLPPPRRAATRGRSAPPPHPTRQNTAPALLAGLTSPSQRSLPRLINGNFPSSTLDSAISLVLPERVVSDSSQFCNYHARPTPSRDDNDSLHATPSLTRRSSHFDVLMSAGQKEERSALFEDDEGDQETELSERQRMAAIQAALNEIIATDDLTASRMSLANPSSSGLEEMRSPTASMMSLPVRPFGEPPKLASRSSEDLKGPDAKDVAPHGTRATGELSHVPSPFTRKSFPSLSPTEKRPSRVLFEENGLDEIDNDVELQKVTSQDMVRLAEPGDLQLGTEITRLQDRIQELVRQEHVLETLIGQAELTGNQAELRLLRRSQSAIRHETRACIFQKAQYEQQEEENRLVPGRTKVSIPSHADTLEHGKQVVRYIVRIEQIDEAGKAVLEWNIARRYNEFHDLDKAIHEWMSADCDKLTQIAVQNLIAELPGKKLVPVLSSHQLDARRSGLQKYLQSLASIPVVCGSHPLRRFLSRTPSDSLAPRSDLAVPVTPMTSLAPHNLVKSLYKTMATSLDDAMLGPSMLDLMYTSLGRQLSDVSGLVGVGGDDLLGMLPQALKSGWAKDSDASPPTGDGEEPAVSVFTAPICDLFIELFDLKENKNNWLRRQAIVVILQQLLGSTIERKVRDTFRSTLQTDSIEKALMGFQELLFPDGERRLPSEVRSDAEKHETKVRASKKVGALIPDVAANMIGRSNARRGARRLFGALQDRRLNQQLVLCILDEIFDVLFPPVA